MNTKIPELIQYLFFGMIIVVGLFRFVREKEWKALSLKPVLANWKPLLLSMVPIAGLLYAGNLSEMKIQESAPYFIGSMLLTYFLSQIGLSGELRSFTLLAAAATLTHFLPDSYELALMGALGGMLVWKVVENLLHKPESRLDDVIAPAVWLVAFYWSKVGTTENYTVAYQNVIMAALTVSIFIRWAQPILIPNDLVYLKRIMLSLTGGLTFLVILNQVLMKSNVNNLAILGGAGLLLTYLLQSLDKNVDDGPVLARSMKNILLVGIATLAASRLFGMQGLLILAAMAVAAPIPGSALIAASFWLARVLMQCFITVYNPNVTGINLMHNYSSAAMYAGFLIVVVASLFIRDSRNRKALTAMFIGAAVVVPAALSYFLHPEPTSAFLVSAGVASVLTAYLAPAVFPNFAADQENVMLLPLLSATFACLSHELLDLGTGSTNESRVVVLCSLAGFAVVFAALNHFLLTDRQKKPDISVESPSA